MAAVITNVLNQQVSQRPPIFKELSYKRDSENTIKNSIVKVGSTVKNVAIKSAPTVNKGLEGVYGALATGFDMGVKGVSKGVSTVSKMAKKRRSSKRSKRGGTRRKY